MFKIPAVYAEDYIDMSLFGATPEYYVLQSDAYDHIMWDVDGDGVGVGGVDGADGICVNSSDGFVQPDAEEGIHNKGVIGYFLWLVGVETRDVGLGIALDKFFPALQVDAHVVRSPGILLLAQNDMDVAGLHAGI